MGSVWCPVFHLHQPLYPESMVHYYDECAARSYSHHLDVLEKHPSIKANYNISGVLILQMRDRSPELMDGFRKAVERGQAYLTATPYSHAILPIIHERYGEDAVRLQIEKDLALKKREFGVEPRAFRLAEYAVSEPVVKVVSDYFDYLLLSGDTSGKVGFPQGTAVKKGNIKLICRDDGLSNLLAGMDHYGNNYFKWMKDWGGTCENVAEDFSYKLNGSILTDFDGEAIMHHMLCSGVPDDKARSYLDVLYNMAEAKGIKTMHVPEFAATLPVTESDNAVPTSSYDSDGLYIWQGHQEHAKVWNDADKTWELYKSAKDIVNNARRNGISNILIAMMERNALMMQTNALMSQISCWQWALTHDYPSEWKMQPQHYREENERLYAQLISQDTQSPVLAVV